VRIVDTAVGPYERVVWAHDPDSGLQAIVAVHSTALGPAVGGCRFFPYPDQATATLDALRLAEGMTLKSAAAGLELGGGKAVIIGDPVTAKTPEVLAAFARVLDLFEGRYYTAEDVGTSTADMDTLRSLTPYALGVSTDRGGSGDPSPYTSRGVFAAMRAGWEASAGGASLAGARVVIQGVGKVGADVARLAADDSAEVVVADIAADRAAQVATDIGGVAIAAELALVTACDVLSPCALGGVINDETVPNLRCRMICGGANNQLENDEASMLLQARGIDYVPDFIANAGGIIAIAEERNGFDRARAMALADGIGDVVRTIVGEARAEGRSALAVSRRRAARRLAAAAPTE
jgi:glutamate dehydrogenase/leucine dehydrogenase